MYARKEQTLKTALKTVCNERCKCLRANVRQKAAGKHEKRMNAAVNGKKARVQVIEMKRGNLMEKRCKGMQAKKARRGSMLQVRTK